MLNLFIYVSLCVRVCIAYVWLYLREVSVDKCEVLHKAKSNAAVNTAAVMGVIY